jgi:hypothetical protein
MCLLISFCHRKESRHRYEDEEFFGAEAFSSLGLCSHKTRDLSRQTESDLTISKIDSKGRREPEFRDESGAKKRGSARRLSIELAPTWD